MINLIFYVSRNYNCVVGFSDHSIGTIAAKTAVALGATIVEKHFKLDFLKNCDEVFLTGTAVEITPVSHIKDFNFKDRKLTKFLISEF